ncbi:MAG: ATP-binding protein [Deltaproteobacteria bacterium]
MILKAKPGAALTPMEIVGRDGLVALLCECLAHRSVLLSGERRIGKTSVLTKLVDALEPRRVIRENVQAFASPVQFAEALGRWAGIEDLEVEWPSAITLALDTIEDEAPNAVIIWDEFTWMLKRIDEAHVQDEAVELLLHLHRERLDRPSLRFVLSGSISIHTAIRRLRTRCTAKDPISDLSEEIVRPLEAASALELAHRISKGESLDASNLDEVLEQLVHLVQGRPYYIHDVLSACARRGDVTIATIDEIVDERISADTWDLADDFGRIQDMFDESEGAAAVEILDWVAEAPMTRREIASELEHSDGVVQSIIETLVRDELLTEVETDLSFRSGLRARAWRHYRSRNS